MTRAVALACLLAGSLTTMSAVTAHAATSRPAQAVHVDAGKRVVVPATVRPGLVDVRNTGVASLYLVRRTTWGVSTFVTDWNSDTSSGFSRHFVTVDHLLGHRDAFVTLVSGTYYLVDGDSATITPEQVRTVTVRGSTWNATPPNSVPLSIAGAANRLSAPATIPAHRYLHVVNATHKTQWVRIYAVGDTTSSAAVSRFVANPTLTGFKYLDLHDGQTVFIGSARQSVYVNARLARGRYLVFTFAFTPATNAPIFGHGQAVAVTVD